MVKKCIDIAICSDGPRISPHLFKVCLVCSEAREHGDIQDRHGGFGTGGLVPWKQTIILES
uniref:Uncharacterized protein n=1 Tax=Anguilla anguilla TaxID=7936 RepID=A0A0E9VE97_ANGAN